MRKDGKMYSDKDPQVAADDYHIIPVKKFWKNPKAAKAQGKRAPATDTETPLTRDCLRAALATVLKDNDDKDKKKYDPKRQ